MEKRSEYLASNKEVFFTGTIVTLFRQTVQWYPDRTAVLDEEVSYTYRQLDQLSDKVARQLKRDGVKSGDIVGCAESRNANYLVRLLGIWKSGAAVVAIDQQCPDAHNQYCIENSNIKLVIDRDYVERCLKAEENSGEEQEAFEECSSRENLAIIIFTSGSTGKAKGVCLTHANIASSVSNFDIVPFCSGDRVACFASNLFVAALYDIAVSLAIGCTFSYVPQGIRKSITKVANYFKEQNVSVAFLPPHMAIKFMDKDEGTPLRMLLVGSEPPRYLKKRPYKIVNVYAASEACALIAHYEITDYRSKYPIGEIAPALRYYIVDEEGKQVKDGQEGELWLCGPQIFAGYLNEPELTKKCFTKNPFSDEPLYQRVFKTSDMVKKMEDGTIDYCRRKDNMCKIRGFRIELNGVEEVLREIDGVSDACVTYYKDAGGTNILFGYYISKEELDHEYLRREMGKKMPCYAIPTGLVRVESFPKKLSGKTDRNGFPVPPEINDHKLLEVKYR